MASIQLQPQSDTESATQEQRNFHYLLATLLAQASYSPDLQQRYLSFLTAYILPHLEKFPNWRSNLTHKGSAFEPSRNVQNDESVVRFSFDPISASAGTPTDPFNQAISLTLANQFGNLDLFVGFDRELWDLFTKELYVWEPEEITKVLSIQEIINLKSCLFGFDLKKKEYGIALKGYLNVFRKAHILEISPAVILFGVVRKLPGRLDEKAALHKLEEFFLPRDGGYEGIRNMAICNIAEVRGLNAVMVSFDFLNASKSRIKIYARSYDLTFSNFKEVYTLGGKVSISERALDVFTIFYKNIFDLPGDWDGVTEHVQRQDSRHSGVLWQFELVHGKQLPEIKLYVPLWNFVVNDAEAARRLKHFFHTQSWDRLEESYTPELNQLFGADNVEKEAGRHSYVSFSYTEERGAYVTLYYAPRP